MASNRKGGKIQHGSDPDDLITTGTKITNTGHFLWNGSLKSNFSLIYGTFSDGGC
jgi:hypothetical protein